MKAETALKVNKAYQEAFSFGGVSPNPPLEVLIEFEKLIDVNDPEKTGKQVWTWKREKNELWRKHMFLTGTYSGFGKTIIDAYTS